MKYAIIKDGIVSNIAEADAPLDASWQPAMNAKIGWRWNGVNYNKVMLSVKMEKATKLKELEELSAAKSGAGVTVNGNPISSDDAAISEITSTLSTMGRKPSESVDVLFESGWAKARKPDLEEMQDAIWMLRQSVGANRRLHHEAIDALTTAQEVIDYDISTGW